MMIKKNEKLAKKKRRTNLVEENTVRGKKPE